MPRIWVCRLSSSTQVRICPGLYFVGAPRMTRVLDCEGGGGAGLGVGGAFGLSFNGSGIGAAAGGGGVDRALPFP